MRTINSPQEMQDLMRECIQVTYQFIDRVNDTFGLHLPKYQITFGLKSGVAGRAQISKKVIKFNPTLLRENPEAFLARTPGHEVVHFAAFAKHGLGIDAHGQEWKNMMVQLGLDAKRCHSYDTSTVPTNFGTRPNPRRNNIIQSNDGVIKTIGIGKVIEFD